ncbi:MAG: hypothetical protein WCB27_01915 [Thermoguttaceae bacterium]
MSRRNALGGFLQGRCLVGKPSSKIGGKIGPKRYGRSVPVLLVGGFEHQGRRRRVEVQLPDGERS